MNEKQTIELLKKIYKSSRTGMEIAEIFSFKTTSSEFEAILNEMRNRYYSIASEADKQLLSHNQLSPESGFSERIGIWTLSRITPIKSTSGMAEICINGCTEGIIDITRFKKNSHSVEPFALELAEKLKKIEHDNIEILESFL